MAKCGLKCEVFSRIVGYYRPLQDWNVGKRAEFVDRKTFIVKKDEEKFLPQRPPAAAGKV